MSALSWIAALLVLGGTLLLTNRNGVGWLFRIAGDVAWMFWAGGDAPALFLLNLAFLVVDLCGVIGWHSGDKRE